MNIITKELMQELLNVNNGTCISLYMPTHRTHPENQQDPILFKNLVKKLESSLREQYNAAETSKMLEPFIALERDSTFWNHKLNGLAVLASGDNFKIIDLPVTTDELTIVANSFHTKPLRKYLQSMERFYVLGLSLQEYHIYEGNKHSLTELELPADVPKNINEALGFELTEPHITVASYGGIGGGNGATAVGGHGGKMHHGQGGKSEEMDIDAERFFRFVAKTINDHYTQPNGLPLILAALPEHHNLFHKVSDIHNLLPDCIDVNPKSVELKELEKRAWKIMEPYYNEMLEKAFDRFQIAKANGTGSDDLNEVATAAAAGRVETVIIEANRQIPGIVGETGSIEKGNLENPKMDDLLDDLGELVTKMGGKVIVVPAEKMPANTGVAAVYRY